MAKKVVKRKTNAKTKPITYMADVVLSYISKMEDKLQSDQSICFIKELLVDVGLYAELWSRIKKRYDKHKKICQAMKRIEDTLENRIVKRMLEGRYSTVGSIFVLKNKYRWIDKVVSQSEQEKDVSGNAVPLEIIIRGHKEENDV